MNTYEKTEFENTINEIQEANRRYKQQKTVVRDAEYIEELLFIDYVNKCTKNKNRYDWLSECVKKAFDQQSKETKAEKESFYMIENMIREDFFNGDKSAKIDRIVSGGYEGYYYSFEINYKKIVFVIAIPVLDKINVDNFYYAHEGKIYCGIKDDCVINYICSSYKIEEVAEKIKDYLF